MLFRRQGRVFDLVVLLLFSSAVLFLLTYWISSTPAPTVKLEATSDADTPTRGFSKDLHPRLHTARLPASLTRHLNITKGVVSPDGVSKTVYLINGEFPGPTIEARSGDQLVVTVSNQLENGEGVAIHWHGLHMKDASHMDGVVGVTQKEIPAGEEFTYKFEISKNQSGTFWYHSHSELQRADGLYGGLVVHRPFVKGIAEPETYAYDEEQLLLIGDWYHRSAVEVQESYSTLQSSGSEPVPDSLLLNGIGRFDCSRAVKSQPIQCENVVMPSFKLSKKTTRLRVVNVGAMSGVSLALNNGNMQVIKIDGGNDIMMSDWVESVGILYPGERVDIITSGDSAQSLSISLDPENFQSMNQALTATQTFPIEYAKTKLKSPTSESKAISKSLFDLSNAFSPSLSKPLPKTAGQTVLVYIHIEVPEHEDHIPIGYMNSTSWIPQAEPLFYLPREQWDEHQFMPAVQATGDWVDIVVNNIDDKGHPFHLHGHDFYVLIRHAFPSKAEYRTYTPFEHSPDYSDSTLYPEPNLVNPRSKDTIHIPGRGYVILRIRANNLGLWFFHCLNIWHQGTGMAMGLDIR